ncbi:ubiquitin-like domain-containing protein [Clostridium sp. CX1]|uniref:3D domain-containing protein n=1 Tax=Clostridium sp. CX1 TaxID=2978346 RepID=UPI0021BF7415|nr:3D domain-containing protein [Clostridium sp. CX1]MCT8975720.1 ubiquitin-like domain-containing protein [Clostridium sp. CX1]
MVEKITSYLKKYFSNGPKFIFMSVSIVLIALTVLIFSTRKTITVSVDGQDKQITTFSRTYKKALSNNNIVVGPKDKTTPSLDSRVEKGKKISIKRAVKVHVEADGRQVTIESAEQNVEKMLQAEGIGLQDFDKVYPAKDLAIKDGLKVVITRVETKEVKENKKIDYTTVVKKDDEMEQGKNKVIQEGQLGEKETVTKVIYENGKEVSRKVITEIIKKQPVQKVVAMGTLSTYTPSRGGKVTYTKSMRMRATAYTADYESTGKSPGNAGFGITATGTVAKRNSSSYSSIAVDPRVIPLGTKLYVDGYGYAVAEDTGGAIKGNKIDLFFNSSSEADNWGVRWVNVYVVK